MNVFWHRRDLRIEDNKALRMAGEETTPVYIFDPEWLKDPLVSDARIKFVLESLKDLNRQYVERGTHLVLLHGLPEDILEELEPDQVFLNRDSNHFDQEKEKLVREKYSAIPSEPAFNPSINRSNWSRKVNQWFNSNCEEPPERFSDSEIESQVSLRQIKNKYDIDPEKIDAPKGGTKEAEERLNNFLENIKSYSGCISSPSKAESKTSHLSSHIRYGCISPRQIYKKVATQKDEGNAQSVEMFLDRIVWQQHFRKKLEDNPELFKKSINPVYRDLHKEKREAEKIEAWKRGETGYPLVDASMRALVQTGWLNFRMRAMCASFFSYILKQWWKEGADFFYKHLIDADVAINYYQWQMQSGLIGVHANRIYNPTKQVEDNDPEGKFIRKYVLELRSVPDKFIAEPWKMPEKVQSECGVEIGRNYPEPVVDYNREAKRARKFFKRKAPEAYSAFEDDQVWKNASLSSRHDRDEILDKAGEAQSDLEKFT